MKMILGFRPIQLLLTMSLGVVLLSFVGLWVAVAAVAVVGGVIQYRNIVPQRSEATWQISERGAQLLWDDGPKAPTPRTIKP